MAITKAIIEMVLKVTPMPGIRPIVPKSAIGKLRAVANPKLPGRKIIKIISTSAKPPTAFPITIPNCSLILVLSLLNTVKLYPSGSILSLKPSITISS